MSHDFSSEVNEIEEYETLKELQDIVTDLYNKSTGEYGTSEQCYKKLIMFKEAK